MKHRYHAILVAAVLLLGCIDGMAQPVVKSMQWQGQTRRYLFAAPAQYDGTSPIPLLVFLHGLNDSVDNHISVNSIPQQFADHYGWLVVMPQALDASVSLGDAHFTIHSMWNARMEINVMGSTVAPNSEVDDAGFIMAMMDSLQDNYPIIADSIFMVGFSMGGFMTHRMAIEHGDRLNAAVAMSGVITLPLSQETPVAPVRMMYEHGTQDDIVSYQGQYYMAGLGALTVGIGAEQTVAYWVEHNQCQTTPTVDTLADRHNDGLRFVRHTYANDHNGAEVQFLQVLNGTHMFYSDERYFDVSYMVEIHDFFTGTHTDYVGMAENKPMLTSVYPNPTSGRIGIQSSNPTTCSLHDALGREVGNYAIGQDGCVVDLSPLPQGVYTIRFADGRCRRVVKM